MRKLLKKYGFIPDNMVTDDLRSYHAVARELGIEHQHRVGRWRNNRAENSHQPTRRRERKQIFPLKHWQDFEELCLTIFRWV
jgi:putative transposase